MKHEVEPNYMKKFGPELAHKLMNEAAELKKQIETYQPAKGWVSSVDKFLLEKRYKEFNNIDKLQIVIDNLAYSKTEKKRKVLFKINVPYPDLNTGGLDFAVREQYVDSYGFDNLEEAIKYAEEIIETLDREMRVIK